MSHILVFVCKVGPHVHDVGQGVLGAAQDGLHHGDETCRTAGKLRAVLLWPTTLQKVIEQLALFLSPQHCHLPQEYSHHIINHAARWFHH